MNNFTMRFIPDDPIRDHDGDLLGFGDFVDLIEGAVLNTEPPFVYGVLGDWGVGKTSVLNLLRLRLDDQFRQREAFTVPIFFNAWRYENETTVIYPLLHEIRRDYLRRMNREQPSANFTRWFRKFAHASATMTSDVVLRTITQPLLGENALTTEDVNRYFAQAEDAEADDPLTALLSGWTDQVAALEDAFRALLDTYATDLADGFDIDANKVRFVILVDDLDRCLPDTTIGLLESIKNYLAVDNRAIFVLGLNAKVVYQGIRHKYGGAAVSGREYLEKILNYTFYVPEPEVGSVRRFVSARMAQLVSDDSRDAYAKYFDTFGKVLEQCEFNNPRKIKRILNRYLLFLNKYQGDLDRYIIENIIRLLIIAEYYPEIFQLMVTGTFDPEYKADNSFGGPKFNINEFEQKTGITIRSYYQSLMRMSALFEFKKTNQQQHNAYKHIQDVFSITRLI